MNENLTKARALLKNIHVMDENIIEPVIVDHPDYTVLIISDDFDGLRRPFAEIISNADLLKLYGYAVRCFEGDPVFNDFDGTLTNSGDFDMENIFADLFYVLTETDSNHVSRIMDYEVHAIKKMKGKRRTQKLRVLSGGRKEDRRTNIPDSPF